MPGTQFPKNQFAVNTPPVPTMTSASVIPELERPFIDPRVPAELQDDIIARPMTLPDFCNVPLVNPNLSPRWIFTDRRRYAQAKAQGWRNAKKADIKPGYAALTPFEEEGGTKYINGDLILMVIDRKIYLGALRFKHQVAAALSDAAVQRTVSAQRAAGAMPEVAAYNQRRASVGVDPVMTVFTPGAADLGETAVGTQAGAAQVARVGGETKLDMGTGADLAREAAKGVDSLSR